MKMQANEMYGADVGFISLVGAGANGQPIKKTKREAQEGEGGRDMLDFRPGKAREQRDKAEGQDLGLVAVIVDGTNTELVEKAEERIKAAGLSVEDRREVTEDKAKAIVFVQPKAKDADIDGEDRLFYPVAKGVGAVVPISKSFAPFSGSTSFTENLQAEGFFPRLSMALEVMKSTAFNIAREAESREDMARKVRKAGLEAVDFIANLAAELPEDVFKLEESFAGEHKVRASKLDMSFSFSQADASPGAAGVVPSSEEAEFASGGGVDRGSSANVGGGMDGGGRGDRMGGVVVKRDELGDLVTFAKEKGLELAEGETTDAFLARVQRLKLGEPAGATQSIPEEDTDKTQGEEEAARAAAGGEPTDFASVLKEALAPITQRLDTIEQGVTEAKRKAEDAEAAVTGTALTGSDDADGEGAEQRSGDGRIALMDSGMQRFLDDDEEEERRVN